MLINYIINLCKNKNYPNILLYNNYDKIIYNVFNKIYDLSNNIVIKEQDILYIRNNLYYEFDMIHIKYKQMEQWLNIIKNICNTNNYFTSNKKMIILNNLCESSINIQNVLKVLFEKNNHVTFVVTATCLSKIIYPIRSRFICIRCSNQTFYNKYLSIEDININDFNRHKHLSKKLIEILKKTNNLSNNDLIDSIILYIFNTYKIDNNVKCIEKLKELSYLIITCNIPMKNFIHRFFSKLLSDSTIINKKKYKIVELFCEYDMNCRKAYYKMIHFEYLLIGIMGIIKI